MADTLEKRVADLEYLLAHIPEDLDARFAGVDVKLAELRELILLQNSRFTKIEARLNEFTTKFDGRLNEVATKLETRMTDLAGKVDAQGDQLTELARKVDTLDSKVDEILARLPKP